MHWRMGALLAGPLAHPIKSWRPYFPLIDFSIQLNSDPRLLRAWWHGPLLMPLKKPTRRPLCWYLFQEAVVLAFYSGVPACTGSAQVRTRHHLIDEGFSIPNLDDHFTQIANVVHSWVHGSFVVFYHARVHAPRDIKFMIFPRSINKRYLVDLRPAENDSIAVIITAYVQPGLLFQTLMFFQLLGQSGDSRSLHPCSRSWPCHIGMIVFNYSH